MTIHKSYVCAGMCKLKPICVLVCVFIDKLNLCNQIKVSFHVNIARAMLKFLLLICHQHKAGKIFVCVNTMARHHPARVLVNLLIESPRLFPHCFFFLVP